MNKYEAMFIFPDAFSEDQLDNAVNNIKGEIEKVGGAVESATRLGRRTFAREMDKTQAGQYVVITFKLDGRQIESLKGNLRFNEEIFRMQIFRMDEKKAENTATLAAKE
ncbi:MAG TPA: 30S ribosomal protein S6 [Kiritimatiellia bacterium]|nr:30S ribosomal protein S6 [Kiritimatiellia bacterium]